jgi:hypothetical protein
MGHYTGLSNFPFYANSVSDLAERIQVNLDRLYKDDKKWTVKVDESCSTSDKNITVRSISCFDALALVNSEFYVNYTIKGRVITIGAEAVAVGKVFGYGKGNGLYDIKQTTNQDTKIITRLRAFGSTKNMPYRYYNKRGLSESQYCPNLMLPNYIANGQDTFIDADGYQDGEGYIQSEDKISLYGIREGTVYFDGSEDLFGTGEDNEIYPTLEGMTFDEVKKAGYDITQPSGDNGLLDEILSVENPDDDGIAPDDGTEIQGTFKLRIKDFGVDLSERENGAYKLASTDGTMTICMKSGMCQGREFEIVENGITRIEEDGYVCYELECNRVEDLTFYYPYNVYKIAAGDKFVITNIQMPDVYVEAAEQRLLASALLYLKEVYETKYQFEPYLDEIYLANNPELAATICEGMLLNFSDEDLGIAASVTISQLVIKEGSALIPTYEVTLNDDVESSTLDKITAQIDKISSGLSNGSGTNSLSKTQVNSLVQTIGKQMFLSKTDNDTAQGKITFKKGLETDGFVSSIYSGHGAGLDWLGNLEVESLKVRSQAQFLELVVNRLRALEGDQILTESDTIESVDDLGDGCYGLHFRSKWDGYFTAQVENNVIKGIINTLAKGSGEYYTSWMRVNSVNTANNYAEVTLYPDDEVPAGKNYPPCETMVIARWGNQTDTTRQSCFYLSSTEGCIKKLVNVTKPIVDAVNDGVMIGNLPDWLQDDPRIDPSKDYLYAMGVICQNFIQVDYKGEPIPTYIDRGLWTSDGVYLCREMNDDGQYEISDVWYMGCKWRCQKSRTTTAPAWNNTDWAMVEGNPEFTVQFAEAEQIYDLDNFEMVLTAVAKLYNFDVTDDILTDDIAWTRYSEDSEGNPRVASDNLWALSHAGVGKSVTLTYADLDADTSSGFPKKIRFTVTVTLRDGMGNQTAEDSASMEYGY